jgi:hypothetical protein
VHFHKFCDACFSSRKEKSSADDSSALNDVPATVRENNHARKINSLKKKMAQISSMKNKSKREGLLNEANALVATLEDAVIKKNKKKEIEEEEEEAGLAEVLVAEHATSNEPISSPKSKPKKKKTAQDDESDRMLASCAVQRFAGCSVPSKLSL